MISHLRISECHDSQYVKPKRIFYTECGTEKSWDIVDSHDSVSVLLYHKERESFLVVKQFRPAVYLKNHDGYTYELCAGIVDKEGKSLAQIASEEILEECGYKVAPCALRPVTTFFSSVGIAGSRQSLFYAQIDQNMRENEGGGIDSEQIELVYVPLDEARAFMFDESKSKTPGLLFAFIWFFERKFRDKTL